MSTLLSIILSIGIFFGSTACFNKKVDGYKVGRPVLAAAALEALDNALCAAADAQARIIEDAYRAAQLPPDFFGE